MLGFIGDFENFVVGLRSVNGRAFPMGVCTGKEPMQGPQVLQFMKDNDVPWPQIYDGQYWQAAVAVEYGVRAIPCPVVVDARL